MIKNIPFIGIYAPFPRSGKGEVLKTFVEAGYKELTFARVVKSTMKFFLMELGATEEQADWHLYDDGKEECIDVLDCEMTGGQLLSTFATDYVRDTIDSSIWLNRAIQDGEEYIEYHQASQPNKPLKGFITQDLRFLNEHEACDVTIRLTRQGITSHTRSVKSEGNLENVKHDFQITNNGTLDDLQKQVLDIIKEIEKDE